MAERARVLWLIKGLGAGGAESLLLSAARHIDRGRFDYQAAYFLPWKDALVGRLEEAGIPVTCLNQGRPWDVRAGAGLVRLLRRERIDILHAHLPYSGIAGRLAARLSPVRAVVYSEHNVWERYHRLTYLANRATFGLNDAVIAVSEDVERSIRAGSRINGRPSLGAIPNGVDTYELGLVPRDGAGVRSELGIPAGNDVVVTVANFTPKKRHTDLMKAAARVVGARPATTFLLVGQGPLEGDVRREAEALGISGSVVFAGFRPDAVRLIAGSDLFVLSSQFEGMPVSILEAMAVGTPVLSTSVGGVPEVVTDGVDGLLCGPLRPDVLAGRILEALGDPALRSSLASAAGVLVRREFDVGRMVRSTEEIYTGLLGGRS